MCFHYLWYRYSMTNTLQNFHQEKKKEEEKEAKPKKHTKKKKKTKNTKNSMSNNEVTNRPTFPFSNLLMLFLQLTSCRSPVSPWSPIRFRKTDASVPLPPTVPVQTVTLYLITAEQKNIIHYIPLYIWQGRFCSLKVNTGAYTVHTGQRLSD